MSKVVNLILGLSSFIGFDYLFIYLLEINVVIQKMKCSFLAAAATIHML